MGLNYPFPVHFAHVCTSQYLHLFFVLAVTYLVLDQRNKFFPFFLSLTSLGIDQNNYGVEKV